MNQERQNAPRQIATKTHVGAVLSSSLIWFGGGMALVFALAFAFTKIDFMMQFSRAVLSNRLIWIILSITIFVMIGLISWKMHVLPVAALVACFAIFCVYMSLLISLVFLSFAQRATTLLLILAIPGVTVLIMGTLGYLQVFDFGKIGWFLLFASIGLIIIGLVAYFTQDQKLYTLYCILGYLLFMLYTGFDLWRIRRTEQYLASTNQIGDKQLIRKYGIIFGLNLLIDYLQLVLFISRFFHNS